MKLRALYLVTVPLVMMITTDLARAEVLRRGLGPEPDSFDIHQAQGLSAIALLREVREGLMTFDAAGALVPGMAQSVSVNEDGRVYRFALRDDAHWSDGSPVVADDFIRGWQRALSPATAARTASLLYPVAGAEALLTGHGELTGLGIRAESPGELVVTLEQPTPWFAEVLAHPVSFPLHPALEVVVAEAPVNGAWQLQGWVPHAEIRLQPNPGHPAASSLALDEVVYLPIEDPNSELSRYRAGELDITETIPPGRYGWLQENLPGQLRISPYLGSFWLGLNLSRAPFARQPDLRRALSLAIDRETLVRVVLGAGELPAWGVVPPGMASYRAMGDRAAHMDKATREAEARRLYAAAGYGNGHDLRVELRFNTSSQHRRMAVAVAAMWKQALGVNTELVNEEWKVFVNNRRQGVVTRAFRGGWIADYADPASFLDLFRAGDELNNTFYANPAYDELLAQAVTSQGSQRLSLLQQAETLLMRDTPVIPLYYYVSRHLVNPRVTGFEDNVRDIHLSRYLGFRQETSD